MELAIIRHSLAHIMAAALHRLYPETKFGIGPDIENGFYYDIELKEKITPDHLDKITQEMVKIIKDNQPFEQRKVEKDEALQIFESQPYKQELIKELKEDQISIFEVAGFVDLCRGPHVESSGQIDPKSFKLSSVAGAYWRGDEKRPMLQRIYGYAFESEKKLNEFLDQLAEAQKRDHRLVGKKLDLFRLEEKLGAGLVLWTPRGSKLKRIIQNFILDKYSRSGCEIVDTPHIARLHLWEISGHVGFYRESMFPSMHLHEIAEDETEDYQIKPMNCPFHILIYQRQTQSYRNLPLRYSELGTVYRYEKSGVLHGLTRVRGFTQDDSHIWCTSEQLSQELEGSLNLALEVLGYFGFKEYDIYLSTRPEKYIGSDQIWKDATAALEGALKKRNIDYQIDQAGGVFYGPKIDIKIKDSIGRSWQCTTIQVDFNLPEKFDLHYIDESGQKQRPIMIHRAILGSIERFIGVLLEHYGGQLPIWLSPTQVMIAPIADRHHQYAQQIANQLQSAGYRAEVDQESKTVNKKILQAEELQIPFILVVGDREVESQKVSVRQRHQAELSSVSLEEFIQQLQEKIKEKS